MSKTKAQIQTELRSLRAKLANAHRLAIELRDRIGNLEAGMADRNGKITRLHDERDAAIKERDEARKAENELRYWKSQHNEVMGKLGAVSQRIDELTAQRDTAEREREEYAGQLTETEKKLGEYSEKLVKTCAAVSFLEGQLTTTEKSRDLWKDEHNKEFDKRLEAEAKLKATNLILVGSDAELKATRDLLVSSEVRARSAESRADYWETRCHGLMRPWWRRTLDGLCSFTSEGDHK